jgi:hypothetical protein
MSMQRKASGPTQPMKDYIEKLLKMKQWDQAEVLKIAPSRDMTYKQAGELIDYLKLCPWKPKAGAGAGNKSNPVTEAGMYKQGDRIFKVQKAVHGSGNLYAKELVQLVPGEFIFEYAKGMINRLSPADKMTLDEAKAFGALYGTCCVCGRTLTDENSIEAGIGPVCAAKF